MTDLKKKNKLDLSYNKYSQFFNTAIIILVTVFIAVLLAVLTEQIKIGKNTPFIFVISTFAIALIFSVYYLIKFHNEMESIMRKIDKLKI
ncbi:MAG: hypothetical protein AABX73_02090 [Nanoarchaeota archaeon]